MVSLSTCLFRAKRHLYLGSIEFCKASVLCEFHSCILRWSVNILHRRLLGCQTKWATFTKRHGSHKLVYARPGLHKLSHQINLCVNLKLLPFLVSIDTGFFSVGTCRYQPWFFQAKRDFYPGSIEFDMASSRVSKTLFLLTIPSLAPRMSNKMSYMYFH